MEARDEIAGLRFWNGDPTVCVLESDAGLNAMLLEKCFPGTSLRRLPEPEQDAIIAGLLRRLWRVPPNADSFRALEEMIVFWLEEARPQIPNDNGLRDEATFILRELAKPSETDVLLATDLHAGNVLRSERKPWLAIDPKPFIGDPAYDTTQHLLNCRMRLAADPRGTIGRFSEQLGIDAERVRLWTFARLALGFAPVSSYSTSAQLARRLAP